jgi:hypothetical protein
MSVSDEVKCGKGYTFCQFNGGGLGDKPNYNIVGETCFCEKTVEEIEILISRFNLKCCADYFRIRRGGF